MIAEYNCPNVPSDNDNSGDSGNTEAANAEQAETTESKNKGTLILDATCAPQNIAYPQDINLLNEARENLESIIDQMKQRLVFPQAINRTCILLCFYP